MYARHLAVALPLFFHIETGYW